MKKTIFFFSALMFAAVLSHAQIRINADVIFGRKAPNPNELRAMKAEEASHPNMAKAMYNIQSSLKYLNDAPDTFGGFKAQAQADLQRAYMSLRKALYYRLYKE